MGAEVVESDMTRFSVDEANEMDKSILHDKENGKLDKGEENNAPDSNFPMDAMEDWPEPKQIHSFYFVRYRIYEDPAIKVKIDQADQEIEKWNKARFKLTNELKAKRSERSDLLSQLRALNVDFEQFKTILDEKKKEIEPLQQALGKLRNNRDAEGRIGLCLSEEELDLIIHSLQYRIQHESIPLTEEKQLLKEIKQLEGTRDQVVANAALRSKIQDSLGQKDVIQDQVKLMGVDLNGIRKEQSTVWSQKKQIKNQLDATENQIESLQKQLKAVTESRDEAYENIQELRRQRDEGNAHFYQSRSTVNKAKVLAAQKDVKALEEVSTFEGEKFMALWNGSKDFRDDYEKRILPSLDSRQLCRDGRRRNPDEEPLVAPEKPVHSETGTVLKPSVIQPKEEGKSDSQPDTKHPKKVSKDAETKLMESKSSSEINVVAEEISGSSKLQKGVSTDKEVDSAKLKELKREDEIAKAKQAMERKKKLAEKAAAKAARRAQIEAEKKLKEREKKAKKKASASTDAANPDESSEALTHDSEPEKVDVNAGAPVSVKEKVAKQNNIRYRNRTKGAESVPRAILKRKKSMYYWIWAAPAVMAMPILVVLGYYYLARQGLA